MHEINPVHLLPKDGEVLYYGKIISDQDATYFFDRLMRNIKWEKDEVFLFGKSIVTKRKVAWYGERAFSYTYSNITKTALPWIDELIFLKSIIEKISGDSFNSCLLNLYHDGSEGMAWHSDAEKDLEANGCIASLSLGAERKFSFKHKTSGLKIDQWLENGSLLLMKGETQKHWLHRLPPTKKVNAPRINLTFRTIA